MDIPVTAAPFLEVFVQYNHAVWPMPLALNGVAVITIGFLFTPWDWTSRMISLLLAGLWLWTTLADHVAFFTAINSAGWWFGVLFVLGAMGFVWFGVVEERLRFSITGARWPAAGAILLAVAIVLYPMLGYALGSSYPAAPTFGVPCPTTIFTIGLLLFVEAPAPSAVFIWPILWSVIGATAALWLGMLEDIALLMAGMVALAALFHEKQSKPVTLGSHESHGARL